MGSGGAKFGNAWIMISERHWRGGVLRKVGAAWIKIKREELHESGRDLTESVFD